MTLIVTSTCASCLDRACVDVCPVDAFAGGERPSASIAQLYIDPNTCIDCGACAPECPVDAIASDMDLAREHLDVVRNAAFFEDVNRRAPGG